MGQSADYNRAMIYADITEFLSNPMGTGIQRTVREIFAHWPDGLPACYFDASINDLRAVAPDALEAVLDNSRTIGSKEKAAKAAEIISAAPGAVIDAESSVLIPELFFDHARCAFYAQRIKRHPSRSLAIVYDLLPWTHPAQFGITDRRPYEPYFNLILSMEYTAHISRETKEEYERSGGNKRRLPLPILHLGADGLSIEKQAFRPDRKTFVCLGSIEARKRQNDILRAFAQLWGEGIDAELIFVGRTVDHGDRSLGPMIEAAKVLYPHFKHYEAASDDDVAAILETARATIMVSTLEGYGLPPVESLHAGIPVIVSDTMPSTRRLPSLGQIRVEPWNPGQIAVAVKRLLDDDVARSLWNDAAGLSLPTWQDTARQVNDWAVSVQNREHSFFSRWLGARRRA